MIKRSSFRATPCEMRELLAISRRIIRGPCSIGPRNTTPCRTGTWHGISEAHSSLTPSRSWATPPVWGAKSLSEIWIPDQCSLSPNQFTRDSLGVESNRRSRNWAISKDAPRTVLHKLVRWKSKVVVLIEVDNIEGNDLEDAVRKYSVFFGRAAAEILKEQRK